MKTILGMFLSLFLAASLAAQEATLQLQMGHSTFISCVSVSANGTLALTGDQNGVALLWELRTGKQIRRLGNSAGLSQRINSCALSDDGSTAITGAWDGAFVWDVKSGKKLHRLGDGSEWVTAVAFSSDGKLATTGGTNHTASIWQVATGTELKRLVGHSQVVTSVAISADNRLALTGSQDRTARLWDLMTGEEIRHLTANSENPWSAFLADGHSAVTVLDSTAVVWNLESGAEIRRMPGVHGPAALSSDGQWMLTSGQKGTVELWDVRAGKEVRLLDFPDSNFPNEIGALAVSADAVRAVTTTANTARVWDIGAGKEVRRLEGHSGAVTSQAISGDGRWLIAGNSDQTAHLWDLASGKEVRRLVGHSDGVTSVAITANGRLGLTAGMNDHAARLWELATGKQIQQFEQAGDVVALSDDGLWALTTVYGEADIWNVTTGHITQRLDSRLGANITAAAFSHDGRLVLTAGGQGSVSIWNVTNGNEISRLTGHTGLVRSGVFSTDGSIVLTGSWDGSSRIWNVASGKQIQVLQERNLGAVHAVALSSDGRWALTGGEPINAVIWDVTTGKKIRNIEGHADVVRTVGFSLDGRKLITGSSDGTVRFWDSDSGEWISSLISFSDGGWAVVDPAGRFDTSELDGGAPLHWIVDDEPLRPLPLEIFMRQYYTPRLLPRLLAEHSVISSGRPSTGPGLPKLPSIAALNRIQPEVEIKQLEPDPNNKGLMRAVVSVKAGVEGGKSGGAQDLRLFRDGQLVKFIPGSLKDGEYPFDGIPLAHRGPNQEVAFTAYVFNKDLVKSETAKQTHTLPANWPERKGRAFLVDIGVNRTTAKGCTLRYAVSDAVAMRSSLTPRLESAGYHVESTLLAAGNPSSGAGNPDGVLLNGASKDRVRMVLADIARKATPDDVFILSYSGHGYTDATGEFYLLPSDLKGDCDRPDKVLQASAISSDDLTQWIRPIDAGEMVMILDACYSAASIESNDFKPGPMGSRGLGQLAYDKRIRVLAASQATQPAGEAGDLQMGYLSYALTKDGLERNQADWQPKDGSIWLREWLAYAVEQVPKLYTMNVDGKTAPTADKNRGIRLNRPEIISLQTPSSFDFRTDQDHGMVMSSIH
jgi:WD40 repeat protein